MEQATLSTCKFHPLSFEVGVALESTFPQNVELEYNAEFAFPDLIRRKDKETIFQVFYPAEITLENETAVFKFIPWVVQDKVLYYRLCFRIKLMNNHSTAYREVRFARANETESFCFRTNVRGGEFINLQLFSFETTTFEPVYMKIKNNNGSFEFYKITASFEDGYIEVKKTSVSQSEVPSFL